MFSNKKTDPVFLSVYNNYCKILYCVLKLQKVSYVFIVVQ